MNIFFALEESKLSLLHLQNFIYKLYSDYDSALLHIQRTSDGGNRSHNVSLPKSVVLIYHKYLAILNTF